jgi:hypothetical protein
MYIVSLPKFKTIMKKSLFLLFASFSFIAANAQIKNDRGTFTKPSAGAIIAEVNFSPNLSGAPTIFSLPGIAADVIGVKARKFVSDKKAYRYLANFQLTSQSVAGESSTDIQLGAGIGVENHLKGAERLSTYWGYEGKLGLVSGENVSLGQDEDGLPVTGKATKFGLVANALAGFDYYIVPNIYLGAEIYYGLGITSSTPEGGDTNTKIELAPGVTGSFRLGWRF